MTGRFLLAFLGLLTLSSLVPAQDWQKELSNIYLSPSFDGTEIEAPDGYSVVDSPAPDAAVLRQVAGPATVKVTNYLERGDRRYYLDAPNREKMWDSQSPEWIVIPGTARAEFIAGTRAATLLKTDTRDFFKEGPVTAEIYSETVPVTPVTVWGPDFRNAEIDLLLPVKVVSFVVDPADDWELKLSVFPAFDSNLDRIPGPKPELYDDPYRVLISNPDVREIRVIGNSDAKQLSAVFLENTVWAAAISEGRVQSLRLGWMDVAPSIEVSKLSPPLFTKTDPMSFCFSATRLLSELGVIVVTPDKISGADFTSYDMLREMGGPFGTSDEDQLNLYMQEQWNIVVDSDARVNVVAPLADGRGAVGMLELESLSLGPSYEDDLKALAAFGKSETPPTPASDHPGWNAILKTRLGDVPASQRVPEVLPY